MKEGNFIIKITKIIPVILISIWLIFLLFMPFIQSSWGIKVFSNSVAISVIIQAGVVLFLLWQSNGIKRTLIIAAIVIIISWTIEALGAAKGFPFGRYSYTERLQPQLAGVPLIIPFAWLMMLPPSWAVARKLSREKSGLVFITLSALAFTAWDLYLDPQMVQWGLWTWDQPGGYFGIPWVNFIGWFAGAAIITALIRPKEISEGMLFLVYILTWIMEFFGLIIFWELPGPALCGLIGMGIFIFPALYFRWRKN